MGWVRNVEPPVAEAGWRLMDIWYADPTATWKEEESTYAKGIEEASRPVGEERGDGRGGDGG